MSGADHPDFKGQWCQDILSEPNHTPIVTIDKASEYGQGAVTNAMFTRTLCNPDVNGIRADATFGRSSKEPDAVNGVEECWLISVGDGLDGKTGRAHGGLSSLILDQLCGSLAHHSAPYHIPPATANLQMDYKAPVSTPSVVFARAWVTKVVGRKYYVRGVIQDGEGKVLAAANSLFIAARRPAL
jgi:acyl-coenzyme A thioesterase PaaI-like protein